MSRHASSRVPCAAADAPGRDDATRSLLGRGPASALHAGTALDPATRAAMQAGFNHDFSRVRVHTDAHAAQSADALHARAYTVGSNVVFARGAFAPASRAGRSLIAHELTHVVQNETHGGSARPISASDDASEHEARSAAQQVSDGGRAQVGAAPAGVVQRLSADEERGLGAGLGIAGAIGLGLGIAWLAGAFDSETFTDEELQEYLQWLDKNRKIQGSTKSDNKARAVVKRWKAGAAGFDVLIVPIRILLINEMASGYLSEGDQDGILDLLRESIPVERAHILPAVKIDQLKTRFDGKRRKSLEELLETQDVESIGLGDEWTVPQTRKVVERHGDGGFIRKVLDLGFKIFRFETLLDTWKYLADGHTEKKEDKSVGGNTEHEVSPKRIRLRKSLNNELAASVLSHESTHAIAGPSKSNTEYLEGEISARVAAERFGYRHGIAPIEPDYRTERGDPNEAAIRKDVTGSDHYAPKTREFVEREYVGEEITTGWE